ncbi:MAG: adenosylmethionine decarboxylase [Chloroflexota bacterium]|nr:adenosylmethionine decarboxylase [Chloroflexota bacterium]
MYALGRHLLLELKNCDKEVLDDLGFLKDSLNEAAVECGASVVGESFYHFSPQGVSGVVNIAESHISIHTWPEYGYAAVDVFTCGEDVKPEKAVEVLTRRLGSENFSAIELRRGIMETSRVGCATE